MTQGETLPEVVANIEEARELWLETVYEKSPSYFVSSFSGMPLEVLKQYIQN